MSYERELVRRVVRMCLDDEVYDSRTVDELVALLWSKPSVDYIEPLLRHDSPRVTSIGIYILSEIGGKGAFATNLALEHTSHPQWTTRFELADHLLSCSSALSCGQIVASLTLVDDPVVQVRCKMMEVLAAVGIQRLSESKDMLPSSIEQERLSSNIKVMKITSDAVQEFVNYLHEGKDGAIVFAGAGVLTAWLSGNRSPLIKFELDNFEFQYLLRRFRRIEERL